MRAYFFTIPVIQTLINMKDETSLCFLWSLKSIFIPFINHNKVRFSTVLKSCATEPSLKRTCFIQGHFWYLKLSQLKSQHYGISWKLTGNAQYQALPQTYQLIRFPVDLYVYQDLRSTDLDCYIQTVFF